MKKVILITAALMICSSVLYSEVVSRILSYNGPGNQIDKCNAITQDQSGFVYATGVSWGGNSKEDYATIKFGESGDFLWVARYNGSGNNLDYASAITTDNFGNVYVTGWSRTSSDFGSEDFLTIKYNTHGVQMWVKRYDGAVGVDCHYYDYAQAIWVDAAGNVYVSGTSVGNDDLREDYLTVKYDNNGNLLWAKRYNGPSSKEDLVTSLAVDASGNIYVTGGSFMTNKGYDAVTVKYNSAGQQQWAARYNSAANKDDYANEVKIDNQGYIYVTGYSTGSSSKQDYVTIKYAPDGTQQWVKTFNGSANDTDIATGLDVDVYRNVYVTGYSKSSSGAGYDYYTVKYASGDGTVLWSGYYNGGSADKAWDIKIVTKGCANTHLYPGYDIPCWIIDVYVTGQSIGTGTSNDFLTIRYDEAGTQRWANRFNGPTNGSDAAVSLSVMNGYPILYAGGSFANDYGIIGITEERPGDANMNFTGLSTTYPNPFNPETKISFNVEKETNVKITVYDILGKTIDILADGRYPGGIHSVNFNGSGLNSGVYFYRIETGYASETKKLVLIK